MRANTVISLVSVLDLDNTSVCVAIHVKDRGNSPEHAGHQKATATQINTLRGKIKRVVSISLYNVNSSVKQTSKSAVALLLICSISSL